MRSKIVRGGMAVFVLFAVASCMDMFDPSGGGHARGRFGDPEALAVLATHAGHEGVTYVLKAKKPEGRIKLRSVYLFSSLPPERRNGPHLQFEMTPEAQLVFTVRKEDLARFSGVTIFGDYQAPELAVAGARSVNIAQEIYFSK